MSKKIVVYSKPACVQCDFTKKYLSDNNIEFIVKDVTESEDNLNEVKNLGFQSLPVVLVEGMEPFSGFRPDLLEKVIKL